MILTSIKKVSLHIMQYKSSSGYYFHGRSAKKYIAGKQFAAGSMLPHQKACPSWRREPDAVPSSQTWPMQKTATVRRPELSLNDHFTEFKYKVNYKTSLYIKISADGCWSYRQLCGIFYILAVRCTLPQLIGRLSIYMDFLSAISAIFASFRRVSPWTRL